MAAPLAGFLARRAALSLAKNKKMREALKSSVSGRALTGFPGGLGIGAGTATVMTDKKSQKPKRATGKPDVYGGTSKKRKIKPKKFR